MGTVAFSVSGRFRFNRLVNGSLDVRFIAFVERFSADDFPVAGRSREVMADFAGSFPGGGDGGEAGVGEASSLGPDSGVEDADDDVVGVVGVWP